MDKKTFIVLLCSLCLIVVAYFIGHHSYKPLNIIKTDTLEVSDTVIFRDTIEIKTGTNTVAQYDSSNKAITTKDSISGYHNMASYKIYHEAIIDSNMKVQNFWDLWIQPTILNYVKYKTVEVTKLETVYVDKPFFMDVWFYTWLVTTVTMLIITIAVAL